MSRRRRVVKPGAPWHGTPKGYRHYGCRCKRCTAAHSAACLKWYHDHGRMTLAERYAQQAAAKKHGTESCYNSGCNRAECRRVATRARRERRQLQAAVSRNKKVRQGQSSPILPVPYRALALGFGGASF